MTASSSATPAPTPASGFASSRAVSTFARPRALPPTAVGVTLAHAGLLGALVFAPDSAEPVAPPRPLTVSLVTPEAQKSAPQPAPRPEPPEPAVEAPKPAVAPPKPAPDPSPVLAAKPGPTVAEPTAEAPAPTPHPEPVPAPEPAQASTPVAVAEPAPRPATPTPPRPADYLTNPKPPYPRLSRRLGEEGTVRLNILVNPDGSVARLELAQSSGHPRLDRSAMETVQARWKFEPARQAGNPVAAWVIVPIQFTLRS